MHREPHTAQIRGATEAVGVLGATSFVGQWLLARLRAPLPHDSVSSPADRSTPPVCAFSRRAIPPAATDAPVGIRWHQFPVNLGAWDAAIPQWITVCPVWAVAEHFPLLKASGARRLVALSSTSRFTKRSSAARAERAIAARLAAAEDEVLEWSRAHGVVATILRPTLTYDGIHDRNVARIAGFIRRVGFYPLAGAATGLRQPIHADDVAAACQAALAHDRLRDAYELSGGETLTYHDMVERIFAWLGRPPRLARIPMTLIGAATPVLEMLPGLATMATMARRMNEDLVFDHGTAGQDFGFQPRPFALPLCRDSDHAACIDR
jgi:uncharacterized protein YbjT (DUF2867 family)